MGGGSKIVKNCVTSFMDDPILINCLKLRVPFEVVVLVVRVEEVVAVVVVVVVVVASGISDEQSLSPLKHFS